MSRDTKTIVRELEEFRKALNYATKKEYSLEFLDLTYMAQQVADLKQELRIARAKER